MFRFIKRTMRILFLSQVLPFPLDAGPKVRSYYVLRYLARRHDITLVTFVRENDSSAAIEHLRTFCAAVHPVMLKRSRLADGVHLFTALAQRKSFLILRDDLAGMHARIAELVRSNEFDAVHADQLSMAHYAAGLKMRRILDEHNAVWTITQRMSENEANPLKRALLENEARLVQAHEAQILAQFDQVITVTQEDARALTFPGVPLRAPLKTIPICIDPVAVQPRTAQPPTGNIVFLGSMLYPPNVDGVLWFARQVLPLILDKAPDSKFYVIGARPAPAVVELGTRDARIVVTGYVDDASTYLQDSAVFVVPLRAGGGMRVKILDAWARGLPIVTTSLGCEGIRVTPDENLVVADTPETFAASVLGLIHNPGRALKLGQKGREWVQEHFDWQRIYPAFDEVYPDPSPGY